VYLGINGDIEMKNKRRVNGEYLEYKGRQNSGKGIGLRDLQFVN